jgi:HSP20 family protein
MSEMQLEKTTNGVAKAPPASNGVAKAPLWHVTPEMDLYESGDEYLIQLDVPGASADSINVQVVGTRVFIRAEQAAGAPEANKAAALTAFERQLDLPADVDPDSASAELRHGVLEIRIAKSASSRRVKIKVNAN